MRARRRIPPGPPQRAHRIVERFPEGVFKAWQVKRMRDQKTRLPTHKKSPAAAAAGLPGIILPTWPGYPSSGCSPAEPDSVSPDGESYTTFPTAGRQNPKPAKRAHRVFAERSRRKLLEIPNETEENSQNRRTYPPNRQSVHLPVLTRPSVAGSNAPNDSFHEGGHG
jgi:hypothetical protein